MNKREQMLQEVAAFLHTYVKSGYVNVDSFSKKIHSQIEQFEDLFTLRFLLHENTRGFVQKLPQYIRNFKTTTTMTQQVSTGEVCGAINWPETHRKRWNQNHADKLTFVTDENLRSYHTQENIVLKHTLQILYDELFDNDYVQSFYDFKWFEEWKTLRIPIAQLLRKNVYLQRVPNVYPSERMILNAMKHRNPLYREAATLLSRYRRFMTGDVDEKELEQFLRETFILPDEDHVLFELYWIAQIIKSNSEDSTLYVMDGENNLVASWKKGPYKFYIYHDSSGPKDLSFQTYIHELQHSNLPYVQQLHASFEKRNELVGRLFHRNETNIFREGRPDIIIVQRKYSTGKLMKLYGSVR